MGGGRHDVAAVEHFLHHHLVEGGGVSAGALVTGGDLLVGRREERAGAAREIADAQAADGIRVAPVHPVHLRDRQAREKGGGRRQGVERRQVLAVDDQPLEDAPGQVVRVVYPRGGHVPGGVLQPAQKLGGVARRKLPENVSPNVEDGIVVDAQDVAPCGQYLSLRVDYSVPGQEAERLDLFVHSRQTLVKDHGVGDDCAGHAAGLGYIRHSQDVRYRLGDARPDLVDFVHEPCGTLDAFLQGRGGFVHRSLGNGHEPDQVGEVGRRSVQPSRLREAVQAPRSTCEDAIGEAGVAQCRVQVVDVFKLRRVAKGNGGLYGAGVDGYGQAETLRRVGFHGVCRIVFGLDHDRRAPGGREDDVRLQGGRVCDYPGVLGAHVHGVHHRSQQAAEGAVDGQFRVTGHRSCRTVSLRMSVPVYQNMPRKWIEVILSLPFTTGMLNRSGYALS